MAINKAITGVRRSVEWNGETAADIRGLSPEDVFELLNDTGDGVEAMLRTVEQVSLADVDIKDANSLASAVTSQAPLVVVTMAKEMPSFLARLICKAADSEDEESVQSVTKWPIALQFMAIADVCELSFGGAHGFRQFVGNVLALVGVVDQMTAGAAPKVRSTSAAVPH